MPKKKVQALELFPEESESQQTSLPEAFRRIYYHLYSNSKASRAEVIIEDLSLLLLTKLSAEMNGGKSALSQYLSGKGSADTVLLPTLQKAFPELLGPRQSFALADTSLRMALSELAELDLVHAPAHTLGEAFQALIGPRLRGERGQFFTPKSIVRAMVEILDPKPDEAVCDPAAGTGGFVGETHVYQVQRYRDAKLSGQLIGVDKDTGLARLSGALLKALSKGRAHIYNFNSLSHSEWVEHAGNPPEGRFDVVLTNPPFGAKIGIRDEDVLRCFDFGHIWTQAIGGEQWVRTRAIASSQDPQILFLELCVRLLKPNGRMGIVLPEGVFGNKQTAYVWDWLESCGHIMALLDCPRTTFQPGTDTKTNILFFRKAKDREPQLKTRVAVALHCGHDRRGRPFRTNREPYPDDFPHLAKAFHSRSESTVWRDVSLHGVRYLVPRYYYESTEVSAMERQLLDGAPVSTLGELVTDRILTIRKGHEIGSEFYGTGDIPFVRTSDLSNFEISTDPTKAISEQVYETFAKQQKLRVGDVLMVVDGRYRIGATAMLTEHNVRCVVQSHLRILSVLKQQRLDPYALLFALNLPSVKLRMRSLVFIQSTLGTLGNRISELRIPLLAEDGPWTARLERFKETLRHRAGLLADLKAMGGPDYEL